jgi:hypothetical protein
MKSNQKTNNQKPNPNQAKDEIIRNFELEMLMLSNLPTTYYSLEGGVTKLM